MIRNFIYLDSGKLRSLSSQIFEGVTEQVVLSQSDISQQEEAQKGPVASGRILADIFSQTGSTSELRFLEDHAYTLFENHLLESDLIASFSADSEAAPIVKKFVRVEATLQLNDLATTAKLMKDFNRIGEALWRVTNEQMVWSSGGAKIAADGDARRKAGEAGMQLNQKVADAAASLTEFGYQDLLEAHMEIKGGTFSAPLKRSCLREDEAMIVHKYSRSTQMNFVMMGVVTQQLGSGEPPSTPPEVSTSDSIKLAMRLMAKHVRALEDTFSAPMTDETILDPIALYSVL